MLGGSSCKLGGKKGTKKCTKKGTKKGTKKRGGGLCVGNLHPFESSNNDLSSGGSDNIQQVSVSAPLSIQPTIGSELTGGAKKKKTRKAGPYANFVKKNFASVQKKNPKFKATDCIREIAKMWKLQKK